jgi:2-polyprenyl-3-methyl-5-hydroxy-6-metoxy-1,4-benzoquinol methylase
MEDRMPCIVCGDSQAPGLAAWHATCPSCAYESAAFRVAINDQSKETSIDEAEREVALRALRQQNFRVIVDVARRFAPPEGRKLLDVGSAHGWFLEAARDSFDVLGVEPDAYVGSRTAARGLPVRAGYFPDVLQQGERFDVIVFNDVIEHIPDINTALAACYDRLNHGGILILNLPNSRGLFYRLSKLFARLGWRAPFDRLWQKDLPSPHVHYFNPDNLAALVARHRFELVHCGELPALRASGLLQRLRYAGKMSTVSLYAQYVAILCGIPITWAFPSDIIVCVFRKASRAG